MYLIGTVSVYPSLINSWLQLTTTYIRSKSSIFFSGYATHFSVTKFCQKKSYKIISIRHRCPHKNQTSNILKVCFIPWYKINLILSTKQTGSHTRSCFIYILLIVQTLVHSNFDIISSLLALFVARKVDEMTTEMIECYHLR